MSLPLSVGSAGAEGYMPRPVPTPDQNANQPKTPESILYTSIPAVPYTAPKLPGSVDPEPKYGDMFHEPLNEREGLEAKLDTRPGQTPKALRKENYVERRGQLHRDNGSWGDTRKYSTYERVDQTQLPYELHKDGKKKIYEPYNDYEDIIDALYDKIPLEAVRTPEHLPVYGASFNVPQEKALRIAQLIDDSIKNINIQKKEYEFKNSVVQMYEEYLNGLYGAYISPEDRLMYVNRMFVLPAIDSLKQGGYTVVVTQEMFNEALMSRLELMFKEFIIPAGDNKRKEIQKENKKKQHKRSGWDPNASERPDNRQRERIKAAKYDMDDVFGPEEAEIEESIGSLRKGFRQMHRAMTRLEERMDKLDRRAVRRREQQALDNQRQKATQRLVEAVRTAQPAEDDESKAIRNDMGDRRLNPSDIGPRATRLN